MFIRFIKLEFTRPKSFAAPLLVLYVFCFPHITASQPKSFRTYTANEGLVSNHIHGIFQDADGFMWFASFAGISIYDGNHFTNYTAENGAITDNIVFGFFQRSKDETWVIESAATDVFVNRKRVKTIHINGYLLSNYLITNEGKVITGREQTLYEIRDYSPVPLHTFRANLKGALSRIYQAGDHYLIESDSIYLANKSLDIIQVRPGRFFKQQNNTIWVLDSELYLLDTVLLKKGRIEVDAAPISLKKLKINGSDITDFLADRDRFYWILYNNGTVLRIDSEGNPTRFNFTVDNILPMRLVEDSDGNVWLPGESGAIKFFSKHIDVFSIDNGMPSDLVMSIAYDNGRNCLWAATKSGLSCIARNRVNNFKYPSDEYSWVKLLVQGDTLYLGLFGIYVYSIRFGVRPRLVLQKRWSVGKGLDDMITCMQKDNRGNLFFNMENRGLYFASRSGHLQKLRDQGLFSFLVDGDTLWTGAKADAADISRIVYEGDSVKLESIRRFPQLANDHVRMIVKDSWGDVWMGRLKKGLVRLRKRPGGEYTLQNYYYDHGLSNGWVWQIATSRDAMYVATLSGIFKQRDLSEDSIYFDDLSHKYGYISEVYDVIEAPKNNLWLATDAGILRIRNLLYKAAPPPKVYFTNLIVNNKQDSSIFYSSEMHQFSYRQNSLMFEFSATSFTNEDHVLYSYSLTKGADSAAWSTPKKIHTVSLLSLSPGAYKLSVKAITQDGMQSDHPAQYSFVVHAPFWSAWWFRGLVILFVVSLVGSFHRFRLRQLRKVMDVRSKISRDLHDEIGSTLSGIGVMSEMMKKQIETENFLAVKSSVNKINSTSEEILGKMSDIVWAINPNNDTSEKMIKRLKAYANNMTLNSHIAIRLNSDRAAERINLDMRERNNIYLICKEAINNAVKYSQCGDLNIAFNTDDHRLIIEVTDNGRGFNPNGDHDGNGLVNMRSRAKEIGAFLSITSQDNYGTCVKLICKIT